MLAGAQADLRKFLEMDPESAAGKGLLEKVTRKRQALDKSSRPKGSNAPPKEPEVPDWFRKAKDRMVFVSLIARSRDEVNYINETLLSMAYHAKDKWALSVGVAYCPYVKRRCEFDKEDQWKAYNPDELQICGAEWQKQYFRMLNLGERSTSVPKPRNVNVRGEIYPVWSLLEGRIRIIRMATQVVKDEREQKKPHDIHDPVYYQSLFKPHIKLLNGEEVGPAWAQYCSQLLWHGEPYVFQSIRSYLRFMPRWDEHFKRDLYHASRKPSGIKAVLSCIGISHDYREWRWRSECGVDGDGNVSHPGGCVVATKFDGNGGCLKFRRRWFLHSFSVPPAVAFHAGQVTFSSSDILVDAPADPGLNSLMFHEQLTVENVRLHTHGWDVHAPSGNYLFETHGGANDDVARREMLEGPYYKKDDNNKDIYPERSEIAKAQKIRADYTLEPWESKLAPLDEELLDYPLPTPNFWTGPERNESSPWITGRTSKYRWRKGETRTMTSFERMSGVDFTKKEVAKRALNGGFSADIDFIDNAVAVQQSQDKIRERHERQEEHNRARDAFNSSGHL